jgi:hypothetical protein
VEEIAMKRPKTMADLLTVTDICIESSEAQDRLLESRGKGPSIPWNDEIRETTEDTGTAENNSQIRRRGDPFDASMTQKSGARSTVPMCMIWKSAKFFWITKECRHQQR